MNSFVIPEDVTRIIKTLMGAEEEAYIVGGCVRDLLLGEEPHDWDITSSASPEMVKSLFSRTIDTGLSHGTVTVMLHHEGYEITTYRVDGKYEDYRRPKEVIFTRSLEEDLLRRDFTINAMAYNPYIGLVDLYHGKADLEHGIIRCVGKPWDRFNEDALRMLRAIRFSAKLGFSIEEETYQAILKNAQLISYVSGERILVEITKILLSNAPEKIELLACTKLIDYIMPEYHQVSKRIHTEQYRRLIQVEAKIHLRWSLYMFIIGMDDTWLSPKERADKTREVLKHLRFDNRNKDLISKIIHFIDYPLDGKPSSIRHLIHLVGKELFLDYLQVRRAALQEPGNLSKEEAVFHQVIRNHEATQITELAIKGDQLIAVGLPRGKEIGRYLDQLLHYVMNEPEKNTEEELMKYFKKVWQHD